MTIKEVKIKIDDKEVTVPSNWTVIKACHENGVDVPHYCYHPDLSIAGNCRICMVGVKGAPRPVVACAQPITENMEVTTKGKDIEEARKSVMEFMLINHPLDCPECDQAGECRLQDYSYDYGRDHGRFHEEKVVKSKATMGPHVKYWGSRCIVCTRCVRFTDEVSGTGDLGVIYRGDKSEIALFPGKVMDNPLSMNTVDICPVGALVSSDFLYQTRVWNLHSRPSMCSDCAVGCNTRVDLDAKGNIKRIVPRRNDQVNKEWMCDYGRLSFPYVKENRLMKPMVDGRDAPYKDARKAAAALLKKKHSVVLVSAWNSNETFAAIKEFVETQPARRRHRGLRQSGPRRRGLPRASPSAATRIPTARACRKSSASTRTRPSRSWPRTRSASAPCCWSTTSPATQARRSSRPCWTAPKASS